MRILFVHEVSWFKKVVFEMHDFPELLSLRKHDVWFLDFDEGDPRARFRTVSSIESRGHPGSQVTVVTPPRLLPGILGRLLATIIQPLTFIRLIRKIVPDVVVLYSVPTSGWQIVLLARAKRIPVVTRIIDIPHAIRKTAFRQFVRVAERLVFRHSTFLTTHNQYLREYCIDLGSSSAKSAVIHPGVDAKRFFPAEPNPRIYQEHGLDASDKIIVFMGTLFSFSGLDELLRELAPTLRANNRLKFLIFGDGEQFFSLQQLVKDLTIETQVTFTGRIEYEHLADHLRLGHVAVLPFCPDLVTHGALPGKVLQYLACGLPTVCTPLKGLQSMLLDGEGVVYASDTREMAATIINLLDNVDHRDYVAKMGLNAIKRLCDWEQQIEMFELVLAQTIDGQ